MIGCTQHRLYLSAVADGELGSVPAATIGHLDDCEECREEVDLHRSLRVSVHSATVGTEIAVRARRGPGRRLAMSVGAGALIALIASAAAVGLVLSRPDPVLAAAGAARQEPQFQSSESGRIGTWCEHVTGRSMPELDLTPLAPRGARLDRIDGTGVVTIFYAAPEGGPVAVSWLDLRVVPHRGGSVTAHEVSGRLVLLAASPHGTAVISGAVSPSLLWQTAARIEDRSQV